LRTWEEISLFRDNPCFEEAGRESCYRDPFAPEFTTFFVFLELASASVLLTLCIGGPALGAGLGVLLRRFFGGDSRQGASAPG
jgi:hypothetical protein